MASNDRKEQRGEAWDADDWRELRRLRREAGLRHAEHDLKILSAWQRAGLISIHRFDVSGIHLRVTAGDRSVDFWPTTGVVIRNGERFTKRGARVVLRAIGLNPSNAPEGGAS